MTRTSVQFLELGRTVPSAVPSPDECRSVVGQALEDIEAFQEKHGLVQDGILGPRTRAAMKEEACR